MALPADGLISQADLVQSGNAVSALIPPAFVKQAIFYGLVYSEQCSDSSNKINFRISGNVNAEGVNEGAVYTPSDANSDITDTSVQVTATKVAVGTNITPEALRFGAGAASFARVSDEQGRAIARRFDTDVLALVNSVTGVATASTTMDTDTLLEGQYKVMNGETPPGPLVAVLDYKGVFELRKQVATSGASHFAAGTGTPLFGVPQQNNYVGNFLGIDIYQTSGLSTANGDDQGVIFNPNYAFAAAMGGDVGTEIRWTGHGVASQVPGLSYEVTSWIFYGVALWHDAAACELRSDT